MMHEFFEKYKVKLDEGHALDVMHDQFHCVKKAYKEDKTSKKYLHELKKLNEQICDFFEAMQLDMDDY